MLMKIFADKTIDMPCHKLGLRNWFWIIATVIPMGIITTIIIIITMKMDRREDKE